MPEPLKLDYGPDPNPHYPWQEYSRFIDTIMMSYVDTPAQNMISLSELVKRQKDIDRNFRSNYGRTSIL